MTKVARIGMRFAESSSLAWSTASEAWENAGRPPTINHTGALRSGLSRIHHKWSSAQLSPQERQDVVTTLASEINSAIQKRDDFPYLRDKIVRRVAECAFLFKALANASPEPELRNNFLEVSSVSTDEARSRVDGLAHFEPTNNDWSKNKVAAYALRNC